MSRPLSVIVSIVFFLFSASSGSSEPPPIEIMDHSVAAAPAPQTDPIGPKIGIQAEPYYSQGKVVGVKVVKDDQKRDLWYLTKTRDRKRAKFATNRDIILRVNDWPVKSSSDVLKFTDEGWNSLLIKDTRSGDVQEYWVKLGGEGQGGAH